jgi:hypothetical protein
MFVYRFTQDAMIDRFKEPMSLLCFFSKPISLLFTGVYAHIPMPTNPQDLALTIKNRGTYSCRCPSRVKVSGTRCL